MYIYRDTLPLANRAKNILTVNILIANNVTCCEFSKDLQTFNLHYNHIELRLFNTAFDNGMELIFFLVKIQLEVSHFCITARTSLCVRCSHF